MSEACAAKVYRPRDPQSTPLYRLVETFYEEVKGSWEERFERLYGRWRGFLDRVVSSYVDCGNYSCGFARVRCPECASEYLVAFSCQTRSFCPSCAAKRAALFGAYLVKERCASPCVVSHSCGPLQLKRALPATTQGSGPLPRGSPMPDSSLLAPWNHVFRRNRDGRGNALHYPLF